MVTYPWWGRTVGSSQLLRAQLTDHTVGYDLALCSGIRQGHRLCPKLGGLQVGHWLCSAVQWDHWPGSLAGGALSCTWSLVGLQTALWSAGVAVQGLRSGSAAGCARRLCGVTGWDPCPERLLAHLSNQQSHGMALGLGSCGLRSMAGAGPQAEVWGCLGSRVRIPGCAGPEALRTAGQGCELDSCLGES